MKATHLIIDSEEAAVGYLVDNVFYTDEYLKQNIDLVDNLAVDSAGRIASDRALPSLSYTEAVTRKAYQDIVRQNPFLRDIQVDLEEWKQEKNHGVLQLEGSRRGAASHMMCKALFYEKKEEVPPCPRWQS